MDFHENLSTGCWDVCGNILWSPKSVPLNIAQFNFRLQRLNYILVWVIHGDSPLHF
jgi:hypothetical protein